MMGMRIKKKIDIRMGVEIRLGIIMGMGIKNGNKTINENENGISSPLIIKLIFKLPGFKSFLNIK